MFRIRRLYFDNSKSFYAIDNHYLRRKPFTAFTYLGIMLLFPYVGVKAMGLADRLPIWNNRVTSFIPSIMLFSWSEKEEKRWALTGC